MQAHQNIIKPGRRVTVSALSVALLLGSAAAQDTQGKPELVRDSLSPAVDQLIAQIQKGVQQSGGDLERQQAHWVMAFSTGHYKADPLGAQAAREVATQLVDRAAVQGDQVSARAWEMDVWEYRNPASLTFNIGQDAAGDREQVAALWPTTPEAGSLGGHDTERVAATLTGEFNDPSTILVLLTNTAASVGASSSELLGTSAPEYQQVLQGWTRLQGTQDGATVNLPYTVKSPTGELQNQLQAVVFIPKTFTGASLAQPRSELLKAGPAAAQEAQKPANAGPVLGLLLGALVLGALAFFGRSLLRGGSRGSLDIEGTTFSLRDLRAGQPFAVIAGPGYVAENGRSPVLIPGFPPEAVAEISLKGKDLQIGSVHNALRLDALNGQTLPGTVATVPLRPSQPDHVLEFSGELPGPGGVPKPIRRKINLNYLPGE